MRTAFLSVIALAICCITASTASASIFSNFLTFDGPQHTPAGVPFQGGGEDKLQDDSLTAFFDNGDGALGVGDIFVGVITLSEINSSGRLSMDVGRTSKLRSLPPQQLRESVLLQDRGHLVQRLQPMQIV